MNIVVINGSPSGESGITAQYVGYLERQLPEHRFHVVEVAKRIRQLESAPARVRAVVDEMVGADAVLWAFPVYVMLVSAQLKRFVELLFERVDRSALAGKVSSSLSTSAHHYDHTAHEYMRGICADLGLTYVRGFSAGQEELLTEDGRRNLLGFARDFLLHASGEPPVEAAVPPVTRSSAVYAPSLPEASTKTSDRKIVVISDAGPEDGNLLRMIEAFERSVRLPVDRLDLARLRMDGGCMGCMRCADDGRCGYQDDYAAAFENRVATADVVIYAGAIRDRYLSARMKVFIDRYFANGHRPVLAGKLMGFIVSGPLEQLPNLREILEAHIECSHCQRLGIVTDEDPSVETTTSRLESMARATERWAQAPWYAPPTFLGHAADKNFRDLVYANQGIMTADHRYYRSHGRYDFPQKQIAKRLFNAVLRLLKMLPFLRRRMQQVIRAGHARVYRRALEGG